MKDLILSLLQQGKRPFEIANQLSLSYDLVQEICQESGILYPGKHLSDSEKQTIRRLREQEGLPIRAIAIRMGRSKTAVGVHVRRRFEKVQDEGGTEVKPKMLKVPRRCPRHGLVRMWPCVACAADPI
ncbi:helix-turn-helix domain-containing protein [Crateriforma conspicua]|uniref:Transposase IS30-like HTH domain-containing protein n=1 Tax=Crateriforma conspicua TaxID=2527996 RepID=A0A5C6FZM3_9PLAN|nr:helix-turn-helix domain-containing protein [Crateriforma conspicua]TWU66433.1 hypothetical protein V7x_19990 [Crateriforma conspicua]